MDDVQLIVVKQLPIIEEQLRSFKSEIEAEVEQSTSLVCTEDTLATVKAARARLRKLFDILEKKRIETKKLILSPYVQFEQIYQECVSEPFKNGDAQLKRSIDSVENALKEDKKEVCATYFNEYAKSRNIDFISFEQVGLNITLTASLKKLKEQISEFVDKVSDDLALIATQEYSSEILVEYRRTLNASRAITTVIERHNAIEEEKQRQAEIQAEIELTAAATAKVNSVLEEIHKEEEVTEESALPIPQVETETEQIFEVTFTVRGTHDEIVELKKYLIERGYINE